METQPVLDAAFWITSGSILILLMLSAFFSGSETALTAASRGKLRGMADKGSAGAEAALKLKEDSEHLIGAILLGNNVVNILAASLATALFASVLGDSAVAVATLVMTALVLIFSEVMPKTMAARVARAIGLLVRLFAPVVALVRVIVRGVLRLFGIRIAPGSAMLSVREEIVGALALGHAEGAMQKEDRDRLMGALDLGDRTVEEIMLHRSAIEMIDADAPPEDILTQALASPHTRLPVFRDDRENIVGVIHAKDLLRALDRLLRGPDASAERLAAFRVLDITMDPYFVPETTTLDHQMREFLRRKSHFALVVDEYGALRGLITLEDILEEIVGEIVDEFDIDAEHPLRETPDGSLIVDGAMTIRDLNRARDWQLPDDEANTVAGLVIHEARMIPNPGQAFSFHGFRFEVLARKENRVTRLKIRPL